MTRNGLSPIGLSAAMLVFCLFLLTGCDQGPKLETVHGRITLDGEPLADARVEFQPENGRPCLGRTNAQGEYELEYLSDRKGALQGKHQVRIWTQDVREDEQGNQVEVPERVPARYNTETQLEVVVEEGKSEFNFDLTTE
jgi:hypothetical protein